MESSVRIALTTDIPSGKENENEFSYNHVALFYGYEDGYWYPDNYLNRAQLAAVYYRMLAKPIVKNTRAISDVDTDHWAYTEIQFAVSEGLLTLDSGAFRPEDYCTHADLGRLFNYVLSSDFGFTSSENIIRIDAARAIVEYTNRHKKPITNGASLYSWPDIPTSYEHYWIVMEVSNDHDWYTDSNGQEYWDN